MLTHSQLQIAISRAKRHFAKIQIKYPELKAYLVLSLAEGQVAIDSSPLEILKEFPAMILDDSAKGNLLHRLKKPNPDASSDVEKARLKEQLNDLIRILKYHEKCQFEIRFHDLKYDLVWKLQVDDLINRGLTPQTRASIRIVLGTLAYFVEIEDER
ncbi:hypothetical protein BH11VER1_BH11VER1_09020 [soil metagenome]